MTVAGRHHPVVVFRRRRRADAEPGGERRPMAPRTGGGNPAKSQRGVAAFGAAQPVAAMATDVEESVDLPAAVAHDQYRVFAHVGGEEIAGQRDLAVVAEEEPAAREDLLQLLFVDPRLDEDAPADEA